MKKNGNVQTCGAANNTHFQANQRPTSIRSGENVEVTSLMAAAKLVAILRLDDLSHAVDLSRALLRAGVVAQEFTLTNPDALTAIRQVLKEVSAFENGEATLGVGSVRSEAQAKDSIAAGAQFVVTPILRTDVIDVCNRQERPVFSGAFTPTEIATAWECGASMVKVFPARQLGPAFIKDVLAPMPELQLMPTGGINLVNVPDYFAAGAAAVGVGGNLFNSDLVAERNWQAIEDAARRFVVGVQGV